MAEYIEREIALNLISDIFFKTDPDGEEQCGVIKCSKVIRNAPAADVVEVVHGHNKTSMHPVDEFLCSVCGFCCADYTETKYDEDGDYTYSCECEFDYCPKCGAKMDGVSNG